MERPRAAAPRCTDEAAGPSQATSARRSSRSSTSSPRSVRKSRRRALRHRSFDGDAGGASRSRRDRPRIRVHQLRLDHPLFGHRVAQARGPGGSPHRPRARRPRGTAHRPEPAGYRRVLRVRAVPLEIRAPASGRRSRDPLRRRGARMLQPSDRRRPRAHRREKPTGSRSATGRTCGAISRGSTLSRPASASAKSTLSSASRWAPRRCARLCAMIGTVDAEGRRSCATRPASTTLPPAVSNGAAPDPGPHEFGGGDPSRQASDREDLEKASSRGGHVREQVLDGQPDGGAVIAWPLSAMGAVVEQPKAAPREDPEPHGRSIPTVPAQAPMRPPRPPQSRRGLRRL